MDPFEAKRDTGSEPIGELGKVDVGQKGDLPQAECEANLRVGFLNKFWNHATQR